MGKNNLNVKEASENRNFDILIIGGGITGSTTSIFLSKLGYKVAVIEKTDLNKFKPGESLTPECKRFFNLLNVALDENTAIEYFANNSNWGSDETISTSFIFNPYGNGISVDRQRLEHQLIECSYTVGSEILLETTASNIEFSGKIWNISLKDKHNKISVIKSRFIVFATGRISPFNPISTRRNYFDKLIAITAIADTDASHLKQKNLTIEAMPNGWFYTNLLPQNKRVLTIFSDSDLLPKTTTEYFKEQLYLTNWYPTQNDVLIKKGLHLEISDARASWSNYQSGNCWLELGDTAYTIDPLSGQGILKNFHMITFFIEHCESFIHQKKEINKMYNEMNLKDFKNYQEEKVQVYGLESRWKSNLFWNRRKSVL